MELRVLYRREELGVEGLSESTSVGELKDQVEELTGVVKRLQKLVWKGKLLDCNDMTLKEAGLPVVGLAVLYLVGSKEEDVKAIEDLKGDSLLKPFEKIRRRKYEAKVTKAITTPSKYGFLELEPLPGFDDADIVRQILDQLRNDRGIKAVMEKHKWTVGKLKEMYPSGKVGQDPVCVLGFNVNAGAEIHLRIRTDDLEGFRPFWRIKEVLCHELSHNVHSEHNREFYDLMNQIKREAEELDWTKSSGRAVGDVTGSVAPIYRPTQENERPPQGAYVGGKMGTKKTLSAREASAQAAIARLSKLQAQDSTTITVDDNTNTIDDTAIAMQVDTPVTALEETTATVNIENDMMAPTHANKQALETAMKDVESESDKSAAVRKIVTDSAPETAEESSGPRSDRHEEGAQHVIAALQAMGFEESIAQSALAACDNDPERAANWIFSRSSSQTPKAPTFTATHRNSFSSDLVEHQLSEETMTATTDTNSPPPATGSEVSTVEELLLMGFSAAASEQAAQSCQGDLTAAVNFIVSRGMS